VSKKAVLNPDALAGQAFQAYTSIKSLCNARLCVRDKTIPALKPTPANQKKFHYSLKTFRNHKNPLLLYSFKSGFLVSRFCA